MTVSVIIVNWNTLELTAQAVASALSQDAGVAVEVIVVDNGSTDGSVAGLRERFPGIQVIPVGRNLGFAKGNNVGLRRARGDLTLLLNSDAKLRPGALRTLLDAVEAYPEAAAFQPQLILPDGSVQYGWDYQPTLAQELWLVLVQQRRVQTEAWQAATTADRAARRVKAVGLPALLVPTWVWRRIGLLTEATFLFFEESDLSVRLERAGLPMMVVPAAEVEHHVGMSTGRVPHLKRRSHYLSRIWFYDTHRDRLSAAVIRLLSAARAMLGIWRAPADEADQLWRPVFRAALRVR